MAKSAAPKASKKKSEVSFSEAVMVYIKSSSHWYALVQPEIVTIEGVQFLAGKQVTGKEGHRMEGKRTLIPFEHVALVIEFESEDDLWSEPQPKHLPPPGDQPQSIPLTSHEQHDQHQNRPQHGHHNKFGRRHRKNRGNDPRFQGQGQYDPNRDRFNR